MPLEDSSSSACSWLNPEPYPDNLTRTVQQRLKVWRRESARALVMGTINTASTGRKVSD